MLCAVTEYNIFFFKIPMTKITGICTSGKGRRTELLSVTALGSTFSHNDKFNTPKVLILSQNKGNVQCGPF